MPRSENREIEQRFSPEEGEREVPRVELNTRYGMEQFSIGNTISQMMDEEYLPEVYFPERRVPVAKDRQVLNSMLKEIVTDLRRHSDMIKIRLEVKEKGYQSLSPEDRKKIFKIYDRIRDNALKATEKKFGTRMSPKTVSKIKFNTTSELNYSLRERIIEGAEPEEWMVLEPKLRKVDLLDANAIMRYLRNSLNEKGDIQFIKEEAERGSVSEDMKQALQEYGKEEEKLAA